MAATSEQPISQMAKDFGVKASTLHGWVNQYHQKTTIKEVAGNNLEEENNLLRKENARKC